MNQVEIYTQKLAQGDSISLSALDAIDNNFYYTIHTIIFLGSYNNVTTLTLNGIEIKLGGGFVYNQTPIRSVSVTTSSEGVLLIGKKTKKTLF